VSWQDIYEANRDKLDDPDKIFPGQELNIPQG
jgi:nucleoid-associated protein YgaU